MYLYHVCVHVISTGQLRGSCVQSATPVKDANDYGGFVGFLSEKLELDVEDFTVTSMSTIWADEESQIITPRH